MQANVSQLLCSQLKSEVACSIEQTSPNDDQLNVVVKALTSFTDPRGEYFPLLYGSCTYHSVAFVFSVPSRNSSFPSVLKMKMRPSAWPLQLQNCFEHTRNVHIVIQVQEI